MTESKFREGKSDKEVVDEFLVALGYANSLAIELRLRHVQITDEGGFANRFLNQGLDDQALRNILKFTKVL